MARERPHAVLLAAARVGGIVANDTRPAEFIYDNLMIEANVVHAAWQAGVEKLLFLGSTCIYPRLAAQPLAEDALLTGPLEPTNEWYAVAKIAGIKLCQAYRRQHGAHFISAMPTNLYGPHDNYDLLHSHVVGALMVKIHRAKLAGAQSVEIWGTGTPRREFLHVDDCADACVFLLENYDDAGIVNIGVGDDVTITEFAETLARVIGWTGRFDYDRSRPDGTPRKLVDTARINALGWRARVGLEDGLRSAYAWFLANAPEARAPA
jgi:GDP-L-fucose synthase